jgi:futalosine hydrolase
MKKLLLVAATQFEIAPLLNWLEKLKEPDEELKFTFQELEVSILLTGVGLPLAMFQLTRALTLTRYDLLINAGIAGALDKQLELGAVVQVVSETFADLGVEEADGSFTDLFKLNLINPLAPPFQDGKMVNTFGSAYDFLPKVHGITVNKVHGSAASIERLKRTSNASVESMEGAAVFYTCLMYQMPFLEIRSISNYVEPRNRDAWEIALAIEKLNEVLIPMLAALIENQG